MKKKSHIAEAFRTVPKLTHSIYLYIEMNYGLCLYIIECYGLSLYMLSLSLYMHYLSQYIDLHFGSRLLILKHWTNTTLLGIQEHSQQRISIKYYGTRVVSQSKSSITSPESSRLGWKTLVGSRLAIAYLKT